MKNFRSKSPPLLKKGAFRERESKKSNFELVSKSLTSKIITSILILKIGDKQMKLNSLNKKFALASVSLLALTTLAGFGGLANVNAKTTKVADQVSNGEVAIYAQSAAGNTASTTNNDGTNPDTGVANNQTGGQAGNTGSTKNDGSQQSSLEGSTPSVMANVTFSATKYTGTGVPTGVTDSAFSGAKVTALTDATGLADFTGLSDGYYLFHQVTTVNGITTVGDFIVQVNLEDSQAGIVNVYPKLDMSSSAFLSDVVTTNADDNYNGKTPNNLLPDGSQSQSTTALQTLKNADGNDGNENLVNGTWTANKDDQNTTTAAAGNTVNWNINTVFDSSQTSNGDGTTGVTGTYVVTDQLPNKLVDSSSVTDSTVIVNVNNGSGTSVGTLTPTTDYTVTNDSNGKITVTLTAVGQKHVATLLGNADGALNIVIPTTVKTAVVGSATDSATTNIVNAYGADLSTSAAVKSTLNVGGVEMTKTDASTNAALKGATFTVVRADNIADAQAFVEANSAYFNNSATGGTVTNLTTSNAGFVTGDTSGNASTTATSPVTFTTGADGIATFNGLNLVDTDTDVSNTSNYYLVEVAAPSGYQLPNVSTAANLTGAVKASTTPQATDTTITNSKPFALPFTGGEGLAGIIAIASVSGIVAFTIKRRKGNEEEVVK
ncbi:SpaH/EbpB family LPXTG-anchored major pilin [Lactococcus lactis]|uniref:SpaH/EbpB family LPXTG-anchored major pilin n=1 Tax=Lactococcus lactis TaxID=1358 RepID=UPI00223C4DBE|nr:SpaH/EbpB family LPXTG-anchored major pilin [Lactococcus lactis]